MQESNLLYNAKEVYKADVDFLNPSTLARITSFLRITPDFFLGGVQKGGTTSLYAALCQHPQIIPAKFKEVFYYGNSSNYKNGLSYYKQFFATSRYKKSLEGKIGKHALTLDASTNTFDSKEAPGRILKDNPDAKIIFILRNPGDRAFSHYKMGVQREWELADFEKALELEEKRIEDGKTNSLSDKNHNYAYYRLGYKSRGIYVEYLKNWMSIFPNKNILVISSEEFLKNEEQTYKTVCEFLKIDVIKIKSEKLNEGPSGKMKTETKKMLNDFYKPYNEELFKLLNKKFDWD